MSSPSCSLSFTSPRVPQGALLSNRNSDPCLEEGFSEEAGSPCIRESLGQVQCQPQVFSALATQDSGWVCGKAPASGRVGPGHAGYLCFTQGHSLRLNFVQDTVLRAIQAEYKLVRHTCPSGHTFNRCSELLHSAAASVQAHPETGEVMG